MIKYNMLLITILAVSCSAPNVVTNPNPDSSNNENYQLVDFHTGFYHIDNLDGRNIDDPENLVRIAIELDWDGQYGKSAQVFLKASKYDSRYGAWQRSCLASAAMGFLKAGNFDRFNVVMADLDRVTDEAAIAVSEPMMSYLFDIYYLTNSINTDDSKLSTAVESLKQ